jgi:hypothetical protein
MGITWNAVGAAPHFQDAEKKDGKAKSCFHDYFDGKLHDTFPLAKSMRRIRRTLEEDIEVSDDTVLPCLLG